MQLEQHTWLPTGDWSEPPRLTNAQLVLVFGRRSDLADQAWREETQKRWPDAEIVGCSTAGQIAGTSVFDEGAVATAIHFEHTRIALATVETSAAESANAGKQLASELNKPGLAHVLVFSEGLAINGDALVRGLSNGLPSHVTVTGGLSADGEAFRETLVLARGEICRHAVVGVGLYGDSLRVGYGSLGGWDPFGPERLITRSEGNVLYELDGQSALSLYKRYLGEQSAGLPATALLFPLSLRGPEGGQGGVVRTVLAIDEESGSMTFAGDVPQGFYARLMKANFDRLVDGAMGAARSSQGGLGAPPAELAILISCVGRKMVLGQRVEEELDGVRDVLGCGPALAGFYSYGEISPVAPQAGCALHNQTMTITTLGEG
jgi:hypothetical protein